jgi:hypothetical protein
METAKKVRACWPCGVPILLQWVTVLLLCGCGVSGSGMTYVRGNTRMQRVGKRASGSSKSSKKRDRYTYSYWYRCQSAQCRAPYSHTRQASCALGRLTRALDLLLSALSFPDHSHVAHAAQIGLNHLSAELLNRCCWNPYELFPSIELYSFWIHTLNPHQLILNQRTEIVPRLSCLTITRPDWLPNDQPRLWLATSWSADQGFKLSTSLGTA